MEVCSHNMFDPDTALLKMNGVCCNLDCTYCSEIKKQYQNRMTEKECETIIAGLPDSCEIILHGGEPLLDETLVLVAIQAFRKKVPIESYFCKPMAV